MKKAILITGGAGYVGSHAAYLLAQQGHTVVILDTFVHQQPFVAPWARVIREDFASEQTLDELLAEYDIESVMHFAGFIEVGESVIRPLEFYENNVSKSIRLLTMMVRRGICNIIFSSSCAVYGIPTYIPLDENHSYAPMNPYGKNKLTVEYALQDFSTAYGLRYVSLRYFNASGAWPEVGLGEWHRPETHAIPRLLRSIIDQKPFSIFGTDYETEDGSCVRDYIHVRDIADAHVRALEYLNTGGESNSFNLGSGNGFSVRQLVRAAEDVCRKKAIIIHAPRRAGDVPVLVAQSAKARQVLGWKTAHSELGHIMSSAYEWEQKVPFITYARPDERQGRPEH